MEEAARQKYLEGRLEAVQALFSLLRRLRLANGSFYPIAGFVMKRSPRRGVPNSGPNKGSP